MLNVIKLRCFRIKTMKSMKDMKIDFPAYILHVLHGEIKYSMLKFMTLSACCVMAPDQTPCLVGEAFYLTMGWTFTGSSILSPQKGRNMFY